MLLDCQFSVQIIKAIFNYLQFIEYKKKNNAFYRYFVSGPFKTFFFIDLHKLLL